MIGQRRRRMGCLVDQGENDKRLIVPERRGKEKVHSPLAKVGQQGG